MFSYRLPVLLAAAVLVLAAMAGLAVWAVGHPMDGLPLAGAVLIYAAWIVIAAKLADRHAGEDEAMPPCLHAYADQIVYRRPSADLAMHAASMCAACPSSAACPRLASRSEPPRPRHLPSHASRPLHVRVAGGVRAAARRLRDELEG